MWEGPLRVRVKGEGGITIGDTKLEANDRCINTPDLQYIQSSPYIEY